MYSIIHKKTKKRIDYLETFAIIEDESSDVGKVGKKV